MKIIDIFFYSSMSVFTTKALPFSFFFFRPNVSTQCWVFAESDEVQVQSKN